MRDGRVAILTLPFAALLMAAAQQQGPEQTIGVATREADGTIVLQLRAASDGGPVGDALVRYPPRDPHYAAVAKHVGPIPKGGSVSVRRFGDRRE
jgi:hypothetical protein